MISSTHGMYRRWLWLLAGLMVFIQAGWVGMLSQGSQSAAAAGTLPDAARPQDKNDEVFVYHFPVFIHTGDEPGEIFHLLFLPVAQRQSGPNLAQTEAARPVVSQQPHQLCCTVDTDLFSRPRSQAYGWPDCSLCERVKTDLFVKPLLQESAEIELALYDAPFPPFKITDVIAAGGIGRYRSGDLVSSGFDGALTVSSNQPLAIVAILSYDDGEGGSAAYEGIASGSSEVIIPQVKFLAGGVTTNVYVQNVATQQIAFDITFTSASGSNSCTDSVDLAPGSRFVFDAAVLQRCGLQPTFVGSAKVTSSGPVLAATALETGNFTASAYNGFAPNEAGTELVFPLVTRNSPIALTTRFGLYNTSSNDPANVDIGFVKSGLAASCTTQVNLAPGPNIELNISSFLASIPDCQGSGVWEGSAILNSNLPLVTSVHVSVQSDTAAYKGFTTANATDKIALPLIMRNNEGSTSAITIMNGPFDNTTITCTFTGSAETATIPFLQPNESVILDLGDSSTVNLPDGYLGAATCASQPSQPIVGVVSNDNTLGAAALYDAINY